MLHIKHAIRALPLAFVVLLFAVPGRADSAAETRARGLNRDAMEQDYLATSFKAAAAKLQTALRACGDKNCPTALLAKIHSNLGIVYSAGLGQKDNAVEAFKSALKLDPNITPDSNYLTGEVQKAFDEAKKQLGGTMVVEKPVAVLKEKPWTEQATWHPVPVYVEVPEGVKASRVVVRYKAPGQGHWKELALEKRGKGWGGYIPCFAVHKTGTLVYFTTAFNTNLDRVASAGSAANPRKVQLKNAINSRQPSLPGAVPPSECPRPREGLSCGSNDDCPGSKICVELQCVDAASVPNPAKEKDKKRKKNWIGIAYSPDLSIVGSASDACSQAAQSDGKRSCFYAGGQQVTENPLVDPGTLNGGVALGSMRVMLSYDRVLGKRMTIGARAGFAFLGTPKRTDGKSFLPLHLEARFAFHLRKDPIPRQGRAAVRLRQCGRGRERSPGHDAPRRRHAIAAGRRGAERGCLPEGRRCLRRCRRRDAVRRLAASRHGDRGRRPRDVPQPRNRHCALARLRLRAVEHMDLTADATLSFPRDIVFSSYRDKLVELVDYLPNIRRIEVKSREDKDGVVHMVNEWHGGGEIPATARMVLSESMLSWTDYAEWNADSWTCKWRIETHSFKDAVDCQGENRFIEIDGGTRLEIRGKLLIDAKKVKGVPKLLSKSVSKTVEDFLVKKITPNLIEVSDGLRRYLERQQKA